MKKKLGELCTEVSFKIAQKELVDFQINEIIIKDNIASHGLQTSSNDMVEFEEAVS